MVHQSEAELEEQLIQQLDGLGYTRVKIHNEQAVLDNLQAQLGAFNNTTFSSREFDIILNHLAKGSIFEKAKTLRDRFQFTRDDESSCYIKFYDSENPANNLFQVTNQITQKGKYKNRYDVTLMVNGLPLVQIELKRRGIELKEAFNQINRYQRHTFWTNSGLFQYVQVFVISNGVNTKYYANNRRQSFQQTFYWADVNNRNIQELTAFSAAFLNPAHLGKMIGNYIVQNETHKILMVLRPYQYYATEALIKQVRTNIGNGYFWHTTGSGKTLTSFKAAQIIMDLPDVHKVVFVVDRKDLDYQTMKEFNSFKANSVDVTDNTKALVEQLRSKSKLILTTIQKLNNAIQKAQHQASISSLATQRIIFIFDECHRSQFGETHNRIIGFFKNIQLFGFTGTPIFADNAYKNEMGKRTTADLFGECLHKYVITDAIRDENVLKFGIEYIGRYKQKGNTFIDIEVEDIDTAEIYNDPNRLEKISDYIIQHHNQKTHKKHYSAMFAVSSIDNLIQYYDIFKQKKNAGEHDLRIASIFTYAANPDDPDAVGMLPGDYAMVADEPQVQYASKNHRESLDEIIVDYNRMYGTSFSTTDSRAFENYFKDISKKFKEREKVTFNEKDRIDILMVVNMFLTGFDANRLNTMYVDRNFRYHGLIQAFSRTNRILNDQKSQGNILCFRNLKKATDEAISLFSNKEAKEVILVPPYEAIVRKFSEAFANLLTVAPTVRSVDDLPSENEELAFIQAFRELMRIKNVLGSYLDFTWDDIPMNEQAFEDYKSKYLDLYDKVRSSRQKEKESVLDEIDFELELIHRDEVNVAYIIKLLAKLQQTDRSEAAEQKKAILDLLVGEVELRSKRELIQKFIEENLPHFDDVDAIQDEFEKYWNEQKILALSQLCEEEHLNQDQFKALIDAYIYSEQTPVSNDVLKCLDNQPSVLQAKEISERIIARMKEFVEVFVKGMAA
jgi:type I restriction enzyme, R subunit